MSVLEFLFHIQNNVYDAFIVNMYLETTLQEAVVCHNQNIILFVANSTAHWNAHNKRNYYIEILQIHNHLMLRSIHLLYYPLLSDLVVHVYACLSFLVCR